MSGGVSAEVTALEFETENGERRKAVARRHGPVDLARDPQIAEHEFRLLQIVTAAGIPAPTPLWVEGAGDLFATPILVVSYVEGETDFDPVDLHGCLRQLAAALVQIHSIDLSKADLDFLPSISQQIDPPPAQLDESLSEGKIRAALTFMSPPQPRTPVLLHGDFWPGNVLWQAGRLAAVIDWEDAALGDPLADVANARLEILWAFGHEAMAYFSQHYQSITEQDFNELPYWDLHAALRPAGKLEGWGLAPEIMQNMIQRHQHFVEQAIENMSA